jgi:hypothetical protein
MAKELSFESILLGITEKSVWPKKLDSADNTNSTQSKAEYQPAYPLLV